MRRNPRAQITIRSNRSRIINPGPLIKRRNIAGSTRINNTRKAITGRSTGRTIRDHLLDLAVRAGVLDTAVRASAGSVVVLHEAWVADAVVGGGYAYAAAGLLHDDGEDVAVVDEGLLGDGLDGAADGVDFGVGVVGDVELRAGLEHFGFVRIEPGVDVSIKNFVYDVWRDALLTYH